MNEIIYEDETHNAHIYVKKEKLKTLVYSFERVGKLKGLLDEVI